MSRSEQLAAELEPLLAEAQPGEDIEVFARYERHTQVAVRQSTPSQVGVAGILRVHVRSVGSSSSGAAVISSTDPQSLRWALAEARQLRRLSLGEGPVGAAPAFAPGLEAEAQDTAARDSVTECIERARELDRAALAAHSSARDVPEASVRRFELSAAAVNSRGLRVHYAHQEAVAAVRVVAEERDSRVTARADCAARMPAELPLLETAQAAAESAVRLLHPTALDATELPLILSPKATASLLAMLAPRFHGDRTAPSDADRATRLFAAGFDLVDQGRSPGGLIRVPCDDEGTPTQDTVLVRDGFPTGLLQNRSSAERGATAPTGNGWVSSTQPTAIISATNLVLRGPELSAQELLTRPAEAIYVVDIGRARGGVDPHAGTLSLALVGYRLRHGEPGPAVDGAVIHLPLGAFLRSVVALSPTGGFHRPGPAVAGALLLLDPVRVEGRGRTPH
ncbi:metallopeptidase TldD-related protein [Kitasatospora sp. GP82]|uniref:metallopeptidase TldD-related protein n=1 Tax=Kitasatospora sp. GP82 TaxID=3035089 RepID=UPI002475AD76|nr:metallopeptidase TldD-related protein [Kitasatospora sp. GP82]MDH6130304.1 putative Zn-dependent protease [Kitasatospora sp. GP82]